MKRFAWCVGSSVLISLAGSALAADPAPTCEWALRYATDVVSYGERSYNAQNEITSRRLANEARLPAHDGVKDAKLCGCPAAIPGFEQAAINATYANNTWNLEAARQYGYKVRQGGQQALDALRRCAGTG